MIFKTVQADNYCKRPDLNIKAVLFYGSNEGLISEYMQKFAKTVSEDLQDPFAIAELDWEEIKGDVGALISEYSAQSLMVGRRVVILKNGNDDLAKVLQGFIETSKSNSLLLIRGSENLNTHSTLVSYFNGESFLAAMACYDDRGKDLVLSIKQMLAENKLTYSQEAFELLCSMMSNDRKFNSNEIDKLVTYVGNSRHFEVDDVRKVIYDASASLVDDLCFSVFSGLKVQALKIVQYMLGEGIEEVKIIRSLSRHINMLLEAKSLVEQGLSATDAVKKTLSRKLFYRYDMAESQIKGWTRERLFDASYLLYNAEKDCKTTDLPTEDVLSYLVLTLVSAAAKQVKAVRF